MKAAHKKAVLAVLGVFVSAAAVLYFLRGMRGQWGQMKAAFEKANYLYLIPAVGLIAATYALRILRWRVFLSPIKKVPYGAITSATCIGFMSTCVLPFRPGEVIRPYVLHRKSGLSFGHTAGTAPGLERVFDLIGVCFLLVLTWLALWTHVTPTGSEAAAPAGAQAPSTARLTAQETPGQSDEAGLAKFARSTTEKGVYFAVLVAVGLCVLGVAAFFPAALLRPASVALRLLPERWREPLMSLVRSMVQALSFLRSPGRVVAAILLSFGIWACYPLSTYALARGFGLELPLAGALVAQSMITAAVAAPQAPGFIGPFQVAAQYGAKLFGVSEGDAGAFSMMLWAIHVVPITAVGLGFLWYEGLNLRGLAQASQRAAEQATVRRT